METENNPLEHRTSLAAGNEITVGGDVVGRDKITNIYNLEDMREKQYRIALNWDKSTSLRWFDLSGQNLERVSLPSADLIGSNLASANLHNADLQCANLQASVLTNTNFEGANMLEIDLYRSNVSLEQLSRAARLRKARLPDGKLYDGRFNLAEDIRVCQEEAYMGTFRLGGALIAIMMQKAYPPENFAANWYGISKEAYIAGQAWAKHHGIEPFVPFYSLAYRRYSQNFKDRLK